MDLFALHIDEAQKRHARRGEQGEPGCSALLVIFQEAAMVIVWGHWSSQFFVCYMVPCLLRELKRLILIRLCGHPQKLLRGQLTRSFGLHAKEEHGEGEGMADANYEFPAPSRTYNIFAQTTSVMISTCPRRLRVAKKRARWADLLLVISEPDGRLGALFISCGGKAKFVQECQGRR